MDACHIVRTLQSYVENLQDLEDSFRSVDDKCLEGTYKTCLLYSLGSIKDDPISPNQKFLEIDSLIDYIHEELNTGHWSEVSIGIRRAFTAASFVKSIIIMLGNSQLKRDLHELRKDCIKSLDLGILLGAPLQSNPELLTKSASFLLSLDSPQSYNAPSRVTSKRKMSTSDLKFEAIDAVLVPEIRCPSLETFNNQFLIDQVPVKLLDCMTHWNAMENWLDMNYLLKMAGERTVPVEIGSHYADENWCQKLMTVGEFIKTYFLCDKGSSNVGYLAQHNLFDQIPELKNDIHVPEYCFLNDSEKEEEPNINAWFGPKGTVSPLHYDPKNNILAQVFGTKQLILFAPSDSQYLSPHEDKLLSNTSQVDPLIPHCGVGVTNLCKMCTSFKNAKMYKCLLGPGEMIFMPQKWWHHVVALEKSFSVSFWFD